MPILTRILKSSGARAAVLAAAAAVLTAIVFILVPDQSVMAQAPAPVEGRQPVREIGFK
jgi:hypothetical protein